MTETFKKESTVDPLNKSPNLMSQSSPYSRSTHEICQELQVDPNQGLSSEEASQRLKQFGPNAIRQDAHRRPLKILLAQLISPMILLLLSVIGVSLVLGHFMDAAIIAAIVFLNACIGFFQEMKAERSMESIRTLATPEARVLRDGSVLKIPAHTLVPGDIVLLEAGDCIPADIRLLEAFGLQADESLLTGESVPIFKNTEPLPQTDLALGDRTNLGFMGTHITSGRGVGVGVATGSATELGKIAHLVSTGKSGETPLKQRMDRLTKHLVLIAFALCLLIFGIGTLVHESILEILLSSISLSIAALPEGLPAVITISLSLGALALARRGVLVRRLQAVEALGSITTICADKTGTLTLNKMQVRGIFLNGQEFSVSEKREISFPNLAPFFQTLILCNDAQPQSPNLSATGDPMEVALLEFAVRQGLDVQTLRQKYPRRQEIPFDGQKRRMITLHEIEGKAVSLTKGAPESVLSLCTAELGIEGKKPLSEEQRQSLHTIVERMANRGLRVLAIAMKEIATLQADGAAETDLTLLGLVALQDPPRLEAKQAITDCRLAGIRPIMITGDHPLTATAIARELGIYQDGDRVLTGAELNLGGEDLLRQAVAKTSIFARVSPEHKLKIVEALKEKQEIVAMTGDGVNDAPALKKADIGIAMGRGTDVAREASALILMEENFSAIMRAVSEGRSIYDNIRKFVRYMLTTNLGEIATMLFTMAFALPLPLLPVQILWINLVTDGLPAIALGFEPAEKDVMQRPPRNPREHILSRGLGLHVVWVGILMGFLTAGLVMVLTRQGAKIELIRSMAFTTLVLAQMAHVLAIRSETRSLFRIGLFSNYRLLIAVLITILAQLGLLYFQPLHTIFHTTALTKEQLLVCVALSSLILLAVEIEKKIRNRERT